MIDFDLIKRLCTKYLYRDNQAIKVNRVLVIEEYKKIKGNELTYNQLHARLKNINKQDLWEEKNTKAFNDRTDVIIDEAHKLLTPDDLLLSMGLDPDKFELSKHNTLNRWWSDIPSEVLKRIRSGQIKIGFQEKKQEVTTQAIKEAIESIDFKPIFAERSNLKSRGMLELAFSDMHIKNNGNSYQKHQDETITWIESQQWEEIVVLVGGDLFHTNNSTGTTVSGTQVDFNVSLKDMYQKAIGFYTPILMSALENSNRVKGIYIQGNHDKDITLGFSIMLSNMFPQIEFDTDEKPFKYHMHKDVFIGLLHGDKPRGQKDIAKTFFQLFKEDIARAATVEIHSQHLHHERMKDDMGFVIRTLPTANEIDQWTLEQGHVGSRRTFQGFVYNDKKLKAILYIDGE